MESPEEIAVENAKDCSNWEELKAQTNLGAEVRITFPQ